MFIYVIRHKASGREYIGKTVRSLTHRWACHRYDAQLGSSSMLYRAMRKYGVEAFAMELLAVATSSHELNDLEQRFIVERQTRVPHGFNITEGGETGPIGVPRSAESRAKQSAAMKGRTPPNKGVSMSSERLEQHRAAATKAARTPAQIAARSKPKSLKTRAKIAATLTGRRLTPAQRQQWSEVAKRNRAKAAATKAQWTPEQRAENRRLNAEARRQWWARRTPEQLDQIRQQRADTTRMRWAALSETERLAYIKNISRGQLAACHAGA